MSLFPLLIFTLFAWAANDVPKECANLAIFDGIAKKAGRNVGFAEGCRKSYEQIAKIHREMRLAASGTNFNAPVSTGVSQADMLGDAAAIANQGGMTKEARAKILKTAANRQREVVERATKAKEAYIKEVLIVRKSVTTNVVVYDGYAENGGAEWDKVKNLAANYAAAADTAVDQQIVAASNLYSKEEELRRSKQKMEGGDAPKSGVSKNTLVALGGAALISAGVVGGLYWVGKKTVDRADEKAAARIAEADQRAREIIAEAEAAAKRVIEYAKGSVDRVVKNAEGSVDRIYQRIQTNFDALMVDLNADIESAYGKMTTPGLEKLKTEMGEIFDKVEQRANEQNQPGLVERIQSARARVMSKIQAEIDRRNPATTSTSSTTESSSSTGTETNSSTSTESSTNTNSSTNTESSTTSSTNSSTTTATESEVNRSSTTRTTIEYRTPADSR